MRAVRVEDLQRRVDPVRAGGQIRVGQDGAGAGALHGGGDGRVAAGHGDRADRGELRPAQHVDDHGRAGDVGQRFAGQAGGRHAGGDQDDRVHGRGASGAGDLG